MTTLASNASTAAARASSAAGAAVGARHRGAPEAAPTVASRLVVFVLCAAAVLSTLAFGTVHSWSLALFAGGAAFLLLCWTLDAWRTRSLRLSRNLLQLPLAGLFLLGLVQLLPLGSADAGAAAALGVPPARTLSLDPYATRFVLIQLGSLAVYFAAALAFVDSPRRFRLVVRTLVVFGAALAAFGMIMSFVSPNFVMGVRETKQAVGFGPFINRHHFAAFMEMSLALPLGLLFAGAVERERRPLYGFAAAVMAIALILTNSRGGMLALVAEVLFLAVLSGVALRRRGGKEKEGRVVGGLARRAALGAGVVVLLFAAVLLFGGEGALNRLVGTINADDPTTGRLHFWRGTLGIIRDHPVLGVGLGAFGAAYTRYDTSSGVLFRLEQAHNDYLQLLSDAGIVGALLGLVFVVVLFRGALRRMESQSKFRRGVALGALSGCFAVLVHSFFDFTLHTTANSLLFLLLAALATLDGRVEHRRRSHSRPTRPAGRQATTDAATPREKADGGGPPPELPSAGGEPSADTPAPAGGL
ncbi:MAG TPA: O-antigen ligase family protein [Pyrinomonadaceae bacterium]|nr:O-antigen ligase family protein [Pyrinomonadaceae bacterium]